MNILHTKKSNLDASITGNSVTVLSERKMKTRNIHTTVAVVIKMMMTSTKLQGR